MRENIEYQSGLTVSQRAPLYIDVQKDPRARTPAYFNLYASRAGTQIIPVNGTEGLFANSSLSSSQVQADAASGSTFTTNPTDIVPTNYPSLIQLLNGTNVSYTPVTNLSSSWVSGGLLITWTFDTTVQSNSYASGFRISITETGASYPKIFDNVAISTTSSSQSYLLTWNQILLSFGGPSTSFSAITVVAEDKWGNFGPDVTIVGATYNNGLTAPIITVSAINNGYLVSVSNTSAQPANLNYISIEEYVSTSSTAPTNVTYSIVSVDTINPKSIVVADTAKRWVKVRFTDKNSFTYSPYSTAYSVTPTSPIGVDTTPPTDVTINSVSWQTNDIQINYTLPTVSGSSTSVTAASWTSNTITFTASNSYLQGDTINVYGSSNNLYNISGTVVSATSTQFTISSLTNPGTFTGTATAVKMNKPGVRFIVTLVAPTGATGLFSFYTDGTSNITQSHKILSSDLYSQFGGYFSSFTGTFQSASSVDVRSSGASITVPTRGNPFGTTVPAAPTLLGVIDGYTASFNIASANAAYVELYEFFEDPTSWISSTEIQDNMTATVVSGGTSGQNTVVVTLTDDEGGAITGVPVAQIGNIITNLTGSSNIPANSWVHSISGTGPYTISLKTVDSNGNMVNSNFTSNANAGDTYNIQALVASGQSPLNIFSTFFQQRWVSIYYYDNFDNNSLPSVPRTVTPINPATQFIAPQPPTISVNSSTYNSVVIRAVTADQNTNEYVVFYKSSTDTSYTSNLFTVNSFSGGTSTTDITIGNLIPNTSYSFYIKPSGTNGIGSSSNIVTQTTPSATVSTVSNIVLNLISYGLTANWTQASDTPTTIKQYKVDLYTGTTLQATQYTYSTVTSFTGLSPSTTYYVKVTSVDIYGESSSPVTSSTITLGANGLVSDGSPTFSSPQPILTPFNNSIYATWSPITNPDTVTYEVHVSTINNFTLLTTPLTASITNATWTAAVGQTPAFINFTANNSYVIGQVVSITGASNTNYNITGVIVNVGSAFFTVNLSSNPGSWTSGGTPQAAVSTKAFETVGTSGLIRLLPNSSITLSYNTTYYVKIITKDPNGYGPVGTQSSAQTQQVQTTDIAAQSITNSLIGTGAIQSINIASQAITGTLIAPSTINTSNIANNAITGSLIASGAVGTSNIASQAITGSLIAPATISTSNIASQAITGSLIAPATITTTNIANNAITTGQIAANAVTASQIAANTITASQIAANTITASQIAANTITSSQIAANTITANQIQSGTITATQIASNTITASQIAANTITASQIASNTITASQIAANTITASQIAANTITASQIAANTITASQIAAATITGNLIAANTIAGNNIVSNTITASQIAANTITASQIAANTITAGQIASATITAGQIASGTITSGQIDTNNLLVGSKITIGGKTYYITNVNSIGGNVVTYTTSAPHNFVAGDNITISGLTPTGYNGSYSVLASPAPTSTAFSITNSTTGSITSGYTTSTIVSYTPTNQIIIDTTGKGQSTSPFKLYSGTGNYSDTATPFYLDSTGKFSLKDRLYFDGNTTLTVNGVINAQSGNFAGAMTVNSGTMLFGKGVSGTNDGLQINANSYWYSSGNFSIGPSSGSPAITWNGTTLAVNGTINANAGSFTGNVQIASGGSLYSGTLSGSNLTTGYILNSSGLYFNQSGTPTTQIIGSTGQLVTINAQIADWTVSTSKIESTLVSGITKYTGLSASNTSYAIWAGANAATNSDGSAPFSVTPLGKVNASNIVISGGNLDIGGTSVNTTATATSGATTLTVASYTNIVAGMTVFGAGIPDNTTVVSTPTNTTVTISNATTAALTAGTPVYFVSAVGAHITNAGNLYASNANLQGKITATSGSITGALNITGSFYANSTGTSATTSSVVINTNGLAAYDASSNATTKILTTAAANGSTFTTTAATIGGFTINSSSILNSSTSTAATLAISSVTTAGTDVIGIFDSTKNFKMGLRIPSGSTDWFIYAGATTANPPTFYVTRDGVLNATGANLSGTFTIGANSTINGTSASTVVSNAATGATALQPNGTFNGTVSGSATINGALASTVQTGAASGALAVQPGGGVSVNLSNNQITTIDTSGNLQIFTKTSGTYPNRVLLNTSGLAFYSSNPSLTAKLTGDTGTTFSGDSNTYYKTLAMNTDGTLALIGSLFGGSKSASNDNNNNGYAFGSNGQFTIGGTTTSGYIQWDGSNINMITGYVRSAGGEAAYNGYSKIILGTNGTQMYGLPIQGDVDLNTYSVINGYNGYYRSQYPLGPYPRQRMLVEDPVSGQVKLGFGVYYSDTSNSNNATSPSTGGYVGDLWVFF